MVDREARKKTAELMRHLVSGQISNWKFEDSIPASSDLAVSEIYEHEVWFLYSDFPEYKLIKKHRIRDENRPEISRWILFLQTDLEYRWPKYPPYNRLFFTIFSFLTFGILARDARKKWRCAGDKDFWPFLSREEFDVANANPKYLAGSNSGVR